MIIVYFVLKITMERTQSAYIVEPKNLCLYFGSKILDRSEQVFYFFYIFFAKTEDVVTLHKVLIHVTFSI